MRVAFLFPGQNSQHVGMGASVAEAFPDLKRLYFDRADDILGFGLSRLCFAGPEEELVKTEVQQPAIFLVSVALLGLLRRQGIQPEAVAGHSLGEYSALVAAGALGFEQGLRLTRRRGELMAGVAERTPGTMAAILGLSVEHVELICREISPGREVEVANYNSPTQTVISGEKASVERASDLARARGARRVLPLKVSAPFHSRLMAPLAGEFRTTVDQAEIEDPAIPVVANVTGRTETTAHEVRDNLVSQLASPVRWTDSMRLLVNQGFDTVIEVGPGKVLTGLMRSIDPTVSCHNANGPEGVPELVGLTTA